MKMLRYAVVFMVMGAVAGLPLTAEVAARVSEVSGKVEMMEPGGAWEPAEVGEVFSIGATISTGFGSQALLDLGGSVLQVKQLTRMKLEELIEKEGTVSTELFLRVGKVRAKIVTEEGLKTDFKLRSPISTASVRGTEFEYDGERLVVIEGVVLIANPVGQKRTVITREESVVVTPNAPPASPEERREVMATVVADTSQLEVVVEPQAEEFMPLLMVPVEKVEVSVTVE